MNPLLPTPTNSWDELCNILTLIMHNGADLTGWSYGQYTLTAWCILMPSAVVLLIVSASLALANRKVGRYFAIAFLCVGVLCALAAVAMIAYAAVYGQTWAYTEYK
ncbi:MAG: hypothetical protein NC405_00855 [Odoribacter sp.]|nr:hypothetical protein [Odoribacter sp.]